MALLLNDDERALRDAAAVYLAEQAPVAALRHLRDTAAPLGFDAAVWQQVAGLGWPAAPFVEAHGGLGLGWKGLGAVAEVMGRHLSALPLLSSVVLCGGLLADAATPAQAEAGLPAVAGGDRRLALAIEDAPRHRATPTSGQARTGGVGWRLDAERQFVIDGAGADAFVLVMPSPQAGHVEAFVVEASSPGVSVRPSRLVDGRVAATVRFDAVAVGDDARIGQAPLPQVTLDAALDRGRVMLAAEGLGLLRQAFETTVDYLKQRVQFDVPIGSFQALQHRAARLYVGLELLESAVEAALDALDPLHPDASRRGLLASLAKAQMADLSERLLNEAVQMHGGIGVTDEYDLGLFLKRGRVLQQALGDAVFHRDRYAALKGF